MADLKYTVQVDTRGATKNVQGLSGALGGLKKLGVAAAATAIAKGLYEIGKVSIEASKQIENYQNQLRLITDGADDLTRVMGLLSEAAVKNRTSFADTADLYTKLTLATSALGKSEEEVLTVTSKLSQALAVAGADASTTSSVIRQFGQAMASGTVRGDEFNSIVEGLGPALAIMARETGLNVGQLRAMSREGKLSADVMFEMIKNSQALTAAFNQQTVTAEQLEVTLGDAFTRAAAKLAETTGIAKQYREALISITRILDTYTGVQGLTNLKLEEFDEALQSSRFSATALVEELDRDISDLVNSLTMLGTTSEILNQGILAGQGASDIDRLKALTDGTYEYATALTDMGALARDTKAFFDDESLSTEELVEQQQARARAILEVYDKYKQLAEAQKEKTKADQAEYERQLKLDEAYEKFIPTVDKLGKAIENSSLYRSASDSGTYLSQFEKAKKDFDEATEAVRILQETLTNLESGNTTLEDAGERADELRNNLNAAREAVEFYKNALDDATEKQAELNEEQRRAGLTEYQRYLEDIIAKAKETVTETENQKKALEELRALMISDPLNAAVYQQAIDGIVGVKEVYDELRESIGNIESMQDFERVQQAINQAFEDNKISLKEYKDLLPSLQDQLEELNPVLFSFFEAVEQAGNTLADNLAEDLMEGKDVLDSFKNFFKTIVKQMIAEAIKLFIIRQLLQGIFGLFGYSPTFGAGATITDITKIPPVPGRAKGGPVNANSPYMVGEKGPELFVPNTAGSIVPNNRLEAGGPVTNNYITNNISAVDAKSVAQLFAENRQALLGTVEYARKETAYGV